MSIVRFRELSHSFIEADLVYKDTILVPLKSYMGPEFLLVNSKDTFVANFLPTNPMDFNLVIRLLDLGYQVAVYRVNCIKEYSTIRVTSDGYSYFDSNKVYEPTDGSLSSIQKLSGSNLVIKYDSDVLNEEVLSQIAPVESLVGHADVLITISGFVYCIRFKGNNDPQSPVEANYLSEINIYDRVGSEWRVNPTRCNEEFVSIVRDTIGLEVKDGKIISYNPVEFQSQIPGLMTKSSTKDTYDIIYSNSLTLSGLEFKSKVPCSGNHIRLILSGTYHNLSIKASVMDGLTPNYEELYVGSCDSESEDYIIDKLEESLLIEYVSGKISDEFNGTYYLGYTEDPIDSDELKFNLDDHELPGIAFVLDTNTYLSKSLAWTSWKMSPYVSYESAKQRSEYDDLVEEFESKYKSYVNKCMSRLRILGYLAKSLNSVVLTSPNPVPKDQFDGIRNILEVSPYLDSESYSYPYELLIQNLVVTRTEGDIDYNDGLGYELEDHEIAAKIIYDRFTYVITHPLINFSSSTSERINLISLKDYVKYYVVNRYIRYYVDTNYIAKLALPSDDEVAKVVLDRYVNLIQNVDVTTTKSDRKAQMDISMTIATQTKYSLNLTSSLIKE